MMKPWKIERLFTELKFDRGVRFPPDEMRRAQFRAGWEDAKTRGKKYAATVLRRLAWRNLGYRFGQKQGPRAANQTESVYGVLAQRYDSLWVPRSPEDHLLQHYWRQVGGRIYVEVPVGGLANPWTGPVTRVEGASMAFAYSASDPAIVCFSSEAFHQRLRSEPGNSLR